MRNLEARLSPIVHAAINEEVTKRTVGGVLSTERDKVMQDVRARLDRRRQVVRHRGPRRPHQAGRLRRQHHRIDLQPDGVGAQAGRQRAALHRRRRGREDPRRRRPPARGDRRRGLPRRAEGQGRRRRQGLGDLRRVVRQGSAVRPVLSQPRGVSRQLPQQVGRHGPRPAATTSSSRCRERDRRQPGRPGNSRWRGSSSGTLPSVPSR